jgi:ferredoxin
MIITDDCISCGLCAEECSFNAIIYDKSGGYAQAHILEDKCVNCGNCLTIDCPADAIKENYV